jgi:phospholipid/cholesterol/gamma-HCH transport system substrate-binding protein
MRRLITSALVLAVAGGLLVFGTGAEGDEDGESYVVRAIFDNGTFLVEGEEVRVAGAKVGVIESTDVTTADEIASLDPKPHAVPGKAVIVMRIDHPGFQDFRSDASCIIRPQSLLGERFVDCRPTEPRAPGSQPAPPLEEIPEGEPGAGERLLPLEQNGKAVDLDLVNNVMKESYRERFSIILNELGATLASRGDELGDVIDRANPALRETDRVLAILASQDRVLARLAKDSDEVLAPLARQRGQVAGFINSSGETAEASAERRGDIEAQLELFPATLRELRATMIELRGFNDQATPVFADLASEADAIAGATRALGPLARAARPSLITLGDALEEATPDLVASNPVLRDVADLAQTSARPSKNLRDLLGDLRRKGGFERLLGLIYNFSGAVNGIDQYGHFLRTQFLASNCTDYVTSPLTGCQANFLQTGSSRGAAPPADASHDLPEPGAGEAQPAAPSSPPLPDAEPPPAPEAPSSPSLEEAGTLFEFLMEPEG